jgi:hypothetical protein
MIKRALSRSSRTTDSLRLACALGSAFLGLLVLAVPAAAQLGAKIDTTNFIVVGEGLAAGYSNFALIDVHQQAAFPAVMAKQMQIANFPQFLFQPPGMGNIAGFPGLPITAPGNLQDTVRIPAGPKPVGRVNAQPPFAIFSFNVSVPGTKLADALNSRPVPPLFQENNTQQTLINMTIGFPGMVTGVNKPLWTQAEYARNLNASFAMFAIGYYDFVDAVANNDASRLPDQAKFKTDFANLVSSVVPRGVPFLIANIPDPMDSGYATSLDTAAALLTTSKAAILSAWPTLKADDRITVSGLMRMGSQITAGKISPLPANAIVSASVASAVSARVAAVNGDIASLAQSLNAPLIDIKGIFTSARQSGVVANGKVLTADFQGGIYSFDGFYPGDTLQAVIANACLSAINKTFGTSYPLADVNATAAGDPSVRMIPMARPRKTEIE